MFPLLARLIGLLMLSAAALYVVWRLLVGAPATDRPRAILLAVLRLLVFAIVLLMLVNPAATRRDTSTRKPRLLLLLDASASMGLPGATSGTRWQELQAALNSAPVTAALDPFDVRRQWFGQGLLVDEPAQPVSQATNLELSLRQALATEPSPAVLLVTDGAETTGEAESAALTVAQAGSRLYTIGVGSTSPPADMGPLVANAPAVVRENQPFDVTASLAAHGFTGSQEVRISVDGRPARSAQLTLDERRPARATVRMPGLSAGYHLIAVSVPPRPGEATATNNQRHLFVEARRDKTRLVVVAGAPSPDFAALRRILQVVPRTEFAGYVRVAQGTYVHEVGARPQRARLDLRALLKGRHVLALMNHESGGLDAGAIREFVTAGGALAVIGGKRATGYSGLQALLPGTLGAYTEVPVGVAAPPPATALGAEMARATTGRWWTGAPYLSGTNAFSPAAGADVVVRTSTGRPLLATRTVGQGRSLVLAGDGFSRWVLSAQADQDSRRLHEVFWQAVFGWLSAPRADRQVLLLLDPPVAAYGQPVRALVQVARGLQPVNDAQVQVRVRGPQGVLVTLTAAATAVPGRYQAALADLPAGTYTVTAEAAQAGRDEHQLVVEPGGTEIARLTLQERALHRLAEAGRGEYAPLSGLSGLLAKIPQTATAEPRLVASRPFRSWPAFLHVVLICTVDWVLRRRWGW